MSIGQLLQSKFKPPKTRGERTLRVLCVLQSYKHAFLKYRGNAVGTVRLNIKCHTRDLSTLILHRYFKRYFI